MEICQCDDDLFPDGNDDTGTLYFDSAIYQICEDGLDKQSFGVDPSLFDIVFTADYFYYDRIL